MNYSNLRGAYNFIEHFANLHELHEKVINVDMNAELPEQELIFKFIKRDAKVLELGGNVGRSTIVISKLLGNPENHVVLESDPDIAKELTKNKIANKCHFKVVNAALSETPIMQSGWLAQNIEPTHTPLPAGWKYVPTITYKELEAKHNIKFDTLVADCEGCLEKIFKSYPRILDNIHTIIVENDAVFYNADMDTYIKSFIQKNGFRSVECKDLSPDKPCFYQVWVR